MLSGQNGLISSYIPTELTLNADVAEGEITLDPDFHGSFRLSNGPEGHFNAEPCDNPLLLSLVTGALISLSKNLY